MPGEPMPESDIEAVPEYREPGKPSAEMWDFAERRPPREVGDIYVAGDCIIDF